MWNLRGHPHGQLAASTVIRGQDPTWLHRHGHQALLRDFETHDLVSLAEPLIGHALWVLRQAQALGRRRET